MEMPIKDNEHIRADRDAFMDAYLRAREELGRIPGVVGVAFGRKETGGDFSTNVAILVYVREKKPEDEIPPDQRIPGTFEGYRTDVRVVQRAVREICENDHPYDPIQGGIQIHPVNRKAPPSNMIPLGTLGCIVKKRGDSGEDRYLLSNKHVLFPTEQMDEADIEPAHRTGRGDHVYHPYAPRETPVRLSGKLIGIIEDDGKIDEPTFKATRTRSDGSTEKIDIGSFIDCAVARIPSGSTCCGTSCSNDGVAIDASLIEDNPISVLAAQTDRIRGVREVFFDPDIAIAVDANDHGVFDPAAASDVNRVFKVGRTTGVTVGIVTAVNAPVEDVWATLRTGNFVIRHNMIEIALDPLHPTSVSGENCKGNESFSEPGDSGSIVLDRNNMAIGLLWGGPQTTTTSTLGGPHLPLPSRLLKYACHIVVVLQELGIDIVTTDASSDAADAYLPEAEGKVLFASQHITGATTRNGRAPALEIESERTHALAEALRATPAGSVLLGDLTALQRELAHLVRSCRPVKVVWNRNEGPAFLAHVLNHLRGDAARVPLGIGTVSRATLLLRMADALETYGSLRLSEAVAHHRPLIPLLGTAATIEELIAVLHADDAAGAPA